MTERNEDATIGIMSGPLEGLPLPDLAYLPDYEKGFWEGPHHQELRIQQCLDCKRFRHPPTPMCPDCHSLNYEWTKTTGKGKVYSFLIVRAGAHPAIREKGQIPYNVCLIELDDQEGLRIVSNLLHTAPSDIHIGMPVVAKFHPAKDEEDVVLTVFVPDETKR